MKKLLFCMNLLCLAFSLFSQAETTDTNKKEAFFSLTLTPDFAIPMGRDIELFNPGWGIGLDAEYKLPPVPFLAITADFDYSSIPIKNVINYVSIYSLSAGVRIIWEILPRMTLEGDIKGGAYGGILSPYRSDFYVYGLVTPLVSSTINFFYSLFPNLSFGIGASYRNFLSLYNDIAIKAGLTYHFLPGVSDLEKLMQMRPEPLNNLNFSGIEFNPIFPVFFKYYDDHPIGKAVLVNGENAPLKDVKVSLFIKQYMDNPKPCVAPGEIGAGQTGDVDLYGLFTDRVLGISESTKVSAQIIVEGMLEGKKFSNEFIESIRLNDRNAMTWEDDRRAAAFVTLKDPTVMKFAKQITGTVKQKSSKAIDSNLLLAMGLYEALRLFGITYVIDPSTPFQEFSQKKQAVDYLQFPKQTLGFKAGDCDDLSILFSALLESIGIKTSFITVPGHIYMAFGLNMSTAEAVKQFQKPDELIVIQDSVWVPIEITELGGGFLKAWQTGAKEWREFNPKGEAGFFPMNESWKVYEPVGFSGEAEVIELPTEAMILSAFLSEQSKFITREISAQVVDMKEKIEKSGGEAKQRNQLGVLYARYGLYEEALKEFARILEGEEYAPALLNVGNILFLKGDFEQALRYYERANKKAPENPKTLLGMARINHELENYGSAKRLYARVKELDPQLAVKFDYLEASTKEASRASGVEEVREAIVWEE